MRFSPPIPPARYRGGTDSEKVMKATLDLKVTRGPVSWAYFYMALGFALAISGTIVQMITPLIFPWNLYTYAALTVLMVWMFLFNPWFQNKLIGIKNKYVEKAR